MSNSTPARGRSRPEGLHTLARGLVVFVVPDFEPTIGGTTRQTANEARALLGRGYDAIVLTQRIDPSWPRTETRDGLRVVRIGPSTRGSLAMKLLDAHVSWWLWRRRRAIAIVHVVMYPDFAVAAAMARCASRTVMVWAGVGDATDTLVPTKERGRDGLRRIRRRVLARNGLHHVALTDLMAAEVGGALGTSRPEVIPTPVDLTTNRPPEPGPRAEARRAAGVADGEIAVVYAGHLRASKRVDRLVEAVAFLRDQGVAARLFVVGDSRAELDDCSAALRAQVASLGLDDQVRFTGGVADIRPYLWAADVFVLPSDREGLSNALLEALACGVPGVASASAGGDQVLDESCGVVPESADPQVLAAAVRTAADPKRWPDLSAGARARAARYSIEAVTGQYERLYARIGIGGFEASHRRVRDTDEA
ncbi:MAG TPA: glycosyltransferase family 4 protein [Acidimicrobiia bacterium]|jgi:glycosyltransferase involved in cell wall biosynthesis